MTSLVSPTFTPPLTHRCNCQVIFKQYFICKQKYSPLKMCWQNDYHIHNVEYFKYKNMFILASLGNIRSNSITLDVSRHNLLDFLTYSFPYLFFWEWFLGLHSIPSCQWSVIYVASPFYWVYHPGFQHNNWQVFSIIGWIFRRNIRLNHFKKL